MLKSIKREVTCNVHGIFSDVVGEAVHDFECLEAFSLSFNDRVITIVKVVIYFI